MLMKKTLRWSKILKVRAAFEFSAIKCGRSIICLLTFVGRFSRYNIEVGSGRFKTVYKGFDEKRGVDVAWSKILAEDNQLSADQVDEVVNELSKGVGLDHSHVIKTYRCWADKESGCINNITEFFTSGNLRDYCQKFRKTLDIKAVKKWGRQILQGLAYLHQHSPPIVHGDLRADKIYINGYNGEIKIGDLGLAVLVPKRFEPGVMPEGDPSDHYTEAVDIFAFGLVMMELVSRKTIDRHNASWIEVLETIDDPMAKSFITKCVAGAEERPQAADLLREQFLLPGNRQPRQLGSKQSEEEILSSASHAGDNHKEPPKDDELGTSRLESELEKLGKLASPRRSTDNDQGRVECEAGSIRGEDYFFQFTGKIKEGKLHFRLHMQYEGDDADEHDMDESARTSKTINFVYDPEEDTPDEIAGEISSEFNLSLTDKDICAAALKEWLADQGNLLS